MRTGFPDNERLDDPLFTDRLNQLVQGLGLEILARLEGAALNLVQGELADAFARGGFGGRDAQGRRHAAVAGAAGRTGLNQRTQAASESNFCHPQAIAKKRRGSKVKIKDDRRGTVRWSRSRRKDASEHRLDAGREHLRQDHGESGGFCKAVWCLRYKPRNWS